MRTPPARRSRRRPAPLPILAAASSASTSERARLNKEVCSGASATSRRTLFGEPQGRVEREGELGVAVPAARARA
jgi:hypothetical protein